MLVTQARYVAPDISGVSKSRVNVDSLLIWDSLDKGILCQTSGKVAISAAKYVWITHSGLCNLDHWSGDTAIEVCEIIFLSRPRI